MSDAVCLSMQHGTGIDNCADGELFSGYRWSYFASLTDDAMRARVMSFITSINWEALIEFAASLRDRRPCKLLSDIGLGYSHMIRIIEFDDHVRWVARLRMQPLSGNQAEKDMTKRIIGNEYHTIMLVKQETNILVPNIHAVELDPEGRVKAQFMLMDCLRGNVGMDLGMEIPNCYRSCVFSKMAEIQVRLSRVQLPRIGTITGRNSDGSYKQGPIPGIGGPFETATEFFQQWATKVEFGLSEAKLKEAAGSLADELSSSASSFRSLVKAFAATLSVHDRGPFPLCHGDFGHNNMIFDDEYNFLGLIDWETAFAGPWEIFGEFPLTFSIVPPDMDVPWDYDENGNPKDAKTIQKYADRHEYITAVMHNEEKMSLSEGYRLSTALQDSRRQHLATAMRLFQRGKPGWYSKVIEKFSPAGTC